MQCVHGTKIPCSSLHSTAWVIYDHFYGYFLYDWSTMELPGQWATIQKSPPIPLSDEGIREWFLTGLAFVMFVLWNNCFITYSTFGWQPKNSGLIYLYYRALGNCFDFWPKFHEITVVLHSLSFNQSAVNIQDETFRRAIMQ